MFRQQSKSTFLFLLILLIRFFFGVAVGYLWFIAVPFIFYLKTDNLENLEGYYMNERMDGDLLEFYSIAQELENYGANNKYLAERVIIVARIGMIGFLWVCPALGIIWGFSQQRYKTTKYTYSDTKPLSRNITIHGVF